MCVVPATVNSVPGDYTLWMQADGGGLTTGEYIAGTFSMYELGTINGWVVEELGGAGIVGIPVSVGNRNSG